MAFIRASPVSHKLDVGGQLWLLPPLEILVRLPLNREYCDWHLGSQGISEKRIFHFNMPEDGGISQTSPVCVCKMKFHILLIPENIFIASSLLSKHLVQYKVYPTYF